MKKTIFSFFNSFALLIVLLISLAGCQAPDDGVEAEPSSPSQGGVPWNPREGEDGGMAKSPALNFLTHQIPLAYPRGSLGGLDITYINGKLHAAFMMKVLDVGMGTEFYRLFYANNENGPWRVWYLKSSTTRFYFLKTGNQTSNFIRIHRTREGYPYILYINKDNHLVGLYQEGSSFYETNLISEEVGNFTSVLSLSDNKIHIATVPRYYNTRQVKYHAFLNGSLVDSFTYSGSISPSSVENHLTINLYNSKPVIMMKYYDATLRTGRLLMIKDRQGYIIASGVNQDGVFNSYWDDQGRIKTCYRNVLNERYEVAINMYSMSLFTKKANFSRQYQYPLHCFVSRYSQIPFARFNINQTYSSHLEVYSWDGFGEREIDRFERQQIRFMDTRFGILFIGTLDPQTGRPQFLELR